MNDKLGPRTIVCREFKGRLPVPSRPGRIYPANLDRKRAGQRIDHEAEVVVGPAKETIFAISRPAVDEAIRIAPWMRRSTVLLGYANGQRLRLLAGPLAPWSASFMAIILLCGFKLTT